MLFITLPDGGSNFLPFHCFKTGIFRVRMQDFSILPVFRNLVPKIGSCKILGRPNLNGDHNILILQP